MQDVQNEKNEFIIFNKRVKLSYLVKTNDYIYQNDAKLMQFCLDRQR